MGGGGKGEEARVGWELVARVRFVERVVDDDLKKGLICSTSGAGADEDLRYARAVIGASNRVITSGT